MGKKRNRQQDVTEENAGESTESCEEASTEGKCCPHVTKAIDLARVKKALKVTGVAKDCAECVKAGGPPVEEDDEEYEPLIPVLWICLRCGSQGCGRGQRQHAIQHYETPRSDSHCLVLDTHRWSLWCYQCETEINADCRKKLLDVVEFIKKQANSAVPKPSPEPGLPVVTLTLKLEENSKEAKNSDNKKKVAIPSNLPRVKGLTNLGNTCFFNAVLQCLAQTPFLTKVLEDLREPGEKFVLPGGKFKPAADAEEIELPPIEGTLDGWGSISAILHKTLTDMQNSNGSEVYTPSQLLRAVASKLPQFAGGDQHDSHELLRHLLELVRNEDLKRYQIIILNQVGLSKKSDPQHIEDSLKSRVKFYGNQAGARSLGPEQVFRGVLVSTLECLECNHSSCRTEPFLDLSLPVMADKPQPPVVKRKNSGFEDTFHLMGNNTNNAMSKHQLKKERKAARKNRKNRRQHGSNDSMPNQNSISEEKQENNSESEESDADVEDNIEVEALPRPEVGESGYSSEKPSALASPVSPAGPVPSHQSNNCSHPNSSPVNGNLLFSPTDTDRIDLKNRLNMHTLIASSPTDVSMSDITQMEVATESPSLEKITIAVTESPSSPDVNGLLHNSLTVDSDLTSPEGPTVSPLSSPIDSKDSALTPESSTVDNSFAVLSKEDTTRIKADPDMDEFRAVQKQEDRHAKNIKKGYPTQNGIDEITSGFSRLGGSGGGHQSPSRYPSEEGECSVQSCLNQFTALELMSGNNKVSCEACTARENKGKEGKMVCCPSTKQYLISRAPAVLILHLKRFQVQRVVFRKVTKHVAFPPTLDLSPVCKGNKGPKLYALYGVVEHSGTLHGGHYVAYVKTRQPLRVDDPRWSFLPAKDTKDTEESPSSTSSDDSEGDEASARAPLTSEVPAGRWYYVSDSRVMEVDEARVLQSQAYLLFYERIL